MHVPARSAVLAAAATLALALAGCGSAEVSVPSSSPTAEAGLAPTSGSGAASDPSGGAGSDSGSGSGTAAEPVATSQTIDATLATLKAAHSVDEVDSASAIPVQLGGSSATSDSAAVTSADGTVTISAGGTYRLTGELSGQVVVDAGEEKVALILDGAAITSDTSPALAITSADEATIVLADGTTSTLTDGAGYSTEADNAPNAALFSADDFSITGTGALTVTGNTNDGIASKDGLVISSGTITVNALDDGIRGKDYLHVSGGALTVTAGGHALKSDNADEAAVGWVALLGGTQDLTATEDGINAQTILLGASTTTISAADDGAHADAAMVVDGTTLTITESYEGLEALQMTIAAGALEIHADDDGINIAGGVDGSQATGGRGGDMFAVLEGAFVHILGGEIVIYAEGDGFDSNGDALMSGGTLTVHGPTSGGNGAIDVNGTFEITGGTLVAGGSSGMAEAPDAASSQGWVSVTFSGTVPAGTTIEIAGDDDAVLASYTGAKTFSSVIFSTAELTSGAEYTVLAGGEALGTVVAGQHVGGFGPGGGAPGGGGPGGGGGPRR
ncbi:MAG TPA: carbohydrate-binding domain-containing protein [Actinomycetales bacterium]|nr:carbohydrate-binding domain-containing protein [Actinomycetales bacterium]